MAKTLLSKMQIFVLAGDLVVLVFITLYGFTAHGTLGSAGGRLWSTFLPLVLAWLLAAPFFGAYDPARLGSWQHVWRAFLAMIVAGPLAAWGRSVLQGGLPIQPIFVVVIGGFSALGLLGWRAVFTLFFSRKNRAYEELQARSLDAGAPE
jgi:hypothetical protein